MGSVEYGIEKKIYILIFEFVFFLCFFEGLDGKFLIIQKLPIVAPLTPFMRFLNYFLAASECLFALLMFSV